MFFNHVLRDVRFL